MTIGILSLQGDHSLHRKVLNILNIKSIYVNNIKSLNSTDALIIPGGESTAISNLLHKTQLDKAIKTYSINKNIFGTCAGAILMSSKCNDKNVNQLKIIDITSYRNEWGRQIDSFESTIFLNINIKKKIKAKFIRAPKFKVNSNDVKVLSYIRKEPILIRNKRHLVSSFHPEMGSDTSIHEYFIKMIDEK